jgi:chromate transporter
MLLWDIFVLFTRVAVFSWGGGPASLALMQRETTAAGWIGSAEFADAVALGNALPGPIAPQVSAYIGYRLAGVPGAIAAAGGTVLPTTVLMLVMVVAFFRFKDARTLQAMMVAVRPVVVGLLLWSAYAMFVAVMGVGSGWAGALRAHWDTVLLTAISFTVLVATPVNPVWVILGAAAVGFVLYR